MRITYIRFSLHFYQIKRKQLFALHFLFTVVKNLCPFLSAQITNVDFETTVTSTINNVIPNSVTSECNFNLISDCGDKSRCRIYVRHRINNAVEGWNYELRAL